MQAIKEKLSDMSAMRKAKAEAKEEEKAEKEMAKTRVEVAHEVRMAREAEAAMDIHVNRAASKVAEHERKHAQDSTSQNSNNSNATNAKYSTGATNGEGTQPSYGCDSANLGSTGAAGTTSRPGGPPAGNLL